MSEVRGKQKNRLAIVLFVIAGVLIALAIAAFILQGTGSTKSELNNMREEAVVNAASSGLIDSIAQEARAAKLKELRSDKNFRKMGLNEVNETCDAAAQEAREAAEVLYGNPVVTDHDALNAAIETLEDALKAEGALADSERAIFAEMYIQLVDTVPDWTDLVGEAGEDDEKLWALLTEQVPELAAEENAHLKESFLKLARKKAESEQASDDAEELAQLENTLLGAIADWTALKDADDEALWAAITEAMPEAAESGYQAELIAAAKENIANAESGVEAAAEEEDEGAATTLTTQADYSYFVESGELKEKIAAAEEAYDGLWTQLVGILPELENLDNKIANQMEETIEDVVWPGEDDFDTRFTAYAAQGGDTVLTGSGAFTTRLAARATVLMVAGIALLLLALVIFYWEILTRRLGVPRTIIMLFFVYLCLAAHLYDISVPMMIGNVLERMGMYGVLVLAMMPGIQCGIGLNMGMTIGCIAGLMGIVLSLQFDMTGFPALIFACASGALISVPLGWGYSKLLNRMKGNEMTISTYVGFSFVSLMCIGWMMLPFDNPKIIWLLSGHGLRVTHSLLGSFAHLLDNFLAFEIFGVEVPTGVLLFLGVCCLLVWLFSRTKTGIAMTATGSNPRFAEASGISVDKMRTTGTVMSTLIAAIGIVIYSQCFGYAQLYTAPRQLGFIAASAILIGGATVRRVRVSHVLIGVFLFEGVLVLGQQIANAAVAGGGLSEVMRIMISNGIILYALTQSGGESRG